MAPEELEKTTTVDLTIAEKYSFTALALLVAHVKQQAKATK